MRTRQTVYEGMNMRQFTQSLKGETQQFEAFVDEITPLGKIELEEVNVYTDGTLRFGQKRGLGAYGTFWPGRTLEKQPLRVLEGRYGEAVEFEHGVKIFNAMEGGMQTSPRAELAAIILAVAADVQVYIGTDCVAVKNKLVRWFIYKGIKKRWRWIKHPNGDLWCALTQMIEAKGLEAVKIKRTKGHAKEEHITAGITTQRDAWGNGLADASADDGF